MPARLWVSGCYTPSRDGRGSGLRTWRERGPGLLEPAGSVAADSPSYVTWHPRLPVVYAVRETGDGAVTAYRVDEAGSLAASSTLSSGGGAPCQLLALDELDLLLACNYSGGNVAVLRLDAGSGALLSLLDVWCPGGVSAPGRSHPHTAIVRPTGGDGVELWLVDLGLDTIFRSRLDPAGRRAELDPIRLPAGTGPRQVRFAGDTTYVLGEVSGTLLTLRDGGTTTVATTASTGTNYPAHLLLSADARFAYVSNRGPNTIAVLDLTGPTPRLIGETPLAGAWPRHCALRDGVLAVCLERSDLIQFFDVDEITGALTPSGTLSTPSPTCLARRPG